MKNKSIYCSSVLTLQPNFQFAALFTVFCMWPNTFKIHCRFLFVSTLETYNCWVLLYISLLFNAIHMTHDYFLEEFHFKLSFISITCVDRQEPCIHMLIRCLKWLRIGKIKLWHQSVITTWEVHTVLVEGINVFYYFRTQFSKLSLCMKSVQCRYFSLFSFIRDLL